MLNLKRDFELDWRDGAILLFTIEGGKVRDVEYMQGFVEAGKMTRKTLYRHRNRLLENGLLQKDYDSEVDSIVYRVPERYRYLAEEEGLRRSIDEGKSFSIDLQRGRVKSVSRAAIVPLAELVPEGYSPKTLLELAAWMKREPSGWPEDDCLKEAKQFLEQYPHLIPEIGPPSEDPDSYTFMWPDRTYRELNLQKSTSSRFFDLKLVYDAVTADLDEEVSDVGPVFVEAYWSPVVVGYVGFHTRLMPLRFVGQPSEYRVIEKPQSVCVAVRKETDPDMRVMHVETRKGKLDKAWVCAVAKQLKAKKIDMKGYDSLTEDVRRELLLNLRKVFEQHRLLIPSRYTSLIQELQEYSYTKPSSGYVLALALAVDSCLK